MIVIGFLFYVGSRRKLEKHGEAHNLTTLTRASILAHRKKWHPIDRKQPNPRTLSCLEFSVLPKQHLEEMRVLRIQAVQGRNALIYVPNDDGPDGHIL